MPLTEKSDSVRPGGSGENPVILRPIELDSVPMCRICFSIQCSERLLTPCKCKGSIKYVHRSCLEQWLAANNIQSCEICKYHFKTARTRMSCWEWLKTTNGTRERRNLIADSLCFVFITLLGIATLWLCVEGAMYYQKIKHSVLETVAVVVLAVFLIVAYVVWLTLCIKYHWIVWTRWRNNDWHVCVVDREGVSTSSSSASTASATVSLEEPLLQEGNETPRLETRVHFRAYNV